MTTPAPLWGYVAEFHDEHALVAAARRVREAGFRRVDAYSPFPLPDLPEAIGFTRAWQVALSTLIGGLLGAAAGYTLQYYTMAIDYPINVGGRPLHSWPAFVPITFELMVLTASLFTVAALFFLNGLPRPHHPLFNVTAFARATQDGFFLSIAASDPNFERDATRQFLETLAPLAITEVPDE